MAVADDPILNEAGTGGAWRRLVVLVGFYLVSYAILAVATATMFTLLDAVDAMTSLWHGGARSAPPSIGEMPRMIGQASLALATDEGMWIFAGLAAFQTALIAPLVGRLRIAPNGWPLYASVVGVAGIAGTFTLLVVLMLFDLAVELSGGDLGRLPGWQGQALLIGTWMTSGFVWFWTLRRAGRSRDPRGLDRLVRLVFASTVVEIVLAVPIYVLLRRRMDCYCLAPSFVGITLGLATLIWMCGPWALLLLTRRRRDAWSQIACRRCGYSRRGAGSRCPECGTRFDAADAATTD